jgi:hypothetical protein
MKRVDIKEQEPLTKGRLGLIIVARGEYAE